MKGGIDSRMKKTLRNGRDLACQGNDGVGRRLSNSGKTEAIATEFKSDSPGAITQLLQVCQSGDHIATGKLLPLVYDELHRLAAVYMRREGQDHVLQTTALINEAFVKIFGEDARPIRDRSHFFAVAAQVMRHVLVDYARNSRAEKRGGGAPVLSLDQVLVFSEPQSASLLALDEALQRLAELSARQVQVVELRFFAGLSVVEIAQVLAVAPRTVVREWRVAKAWLRKELGA